MTWTAIIRYNRNRFQGQNGDSQREKTRKSPNQSDRTFSKSLIYKGFLAEWTGDTGHTAKLLILLGLAAKTRRKNDYELCYHSLVARSVPAQAIEADPTLAPLVLM